MRKSKRSGCVSFAYFALHKQRKVGRPLGETEVSMQGAAAVKWGCPLGEIKVSMQGAAAVKWGRPLDQNPNLPQKNETNL
ncbi:hypothetical protein [Gallibacterium anatis]|uniref:hypothetical protein n=1 Tax=Gallibacterium anatis TaxID=750 RepID=UPI001E41EABD|nr:hypothetical protein [Gallibacterium anatis]